MTDSGNPAAERLRGTWDQDPPNWRLDEMLDAALLHERRATVERAVNYFLPFIDRDFAGQDAQDRIDARVAAFTALDATASEEPSEQDIERGWLEEQARIDATIGDEGSPATASEEEARHG